MIPIVITIPSRIPSTSAPGIRLIATVTRIAFSSSAPRPRVRTVSGSAIRAKTGQIRALRTPIAAAAPRARRPVEDEAGEHLGEQEQGDGVEQQDEQATAENPKAHGATLRGRVVERAGAFERSNRAGLGGGPEPRAPGCLRRGDHCRKHQRRRPGLTAPGDRGRGVGRNDRVVPAGTYTLANELSINKSLTISGGSAADTIIRAGAPSRVVYVTGVGHDVTIAGVTVRDGSGVTDGAGIYNNEANLSLREVVIADNHASADGEPGQFGGIANGGGIRSIGGSLGLRSQSAPVSATGIVKLAVVGKGAVKKALRLHHRRKIAINVTYAPATGAAVTRSRTAKLIRKPRKPKRH